MIKKKGSAWCRAAGRPVFALLLCLLLLPALGGCEWAFLFTESEEEQVKDTVEEWQDAQGLDPVNDDGSINPDGAAKVAKRVITGSTGDPEVDAALGSDNAWADIEEADRLDEEAWATGDISDADQAIKLRPEDWKYRLSRAALTMRYVGEPDMERVDADLVEAWSLVGPSRGERIQFTRQGIQRLEDISAYWRGWAMTGIRCKTVRRNLADYYEILAHETDDDYSRQMAAQYRRDFAQCPP
jgi:hypothetical protein